MATKRFQQNWGPALILNQLYQNPYNNSSPCSVPGVPMVRIGTTYGIPDDAVEGGDDIWNLGGINYSVPDINGLSDYTPGMRAISLLCPWSTGRYVGTLVAGESPFYYYCDPTNAGAGDNVWPLAPSHTMFTAPAAGVMRLWGIHTSSGYPQLQFFVNGVYIGTLAIPYRHEEHNAAPLALVAGDNVSFYGVGSLSPCVYFTFLPYSWAPPV